MMDTIKDSHGAIIESESNNQGDGRGSDRGGCARSQSYGRVVEMNSAFSSSTTQPLQSPIVFEDDDDVDENDGYVFGLAPGPGLAQGSGRALGPGRVGGVGQSPARGQGPVNLSFIGNNVFPSPGGTQQLPIIP